jgi:hypothetical protein
MPTIKRDLSAFEPRSVGALRGGHDRGVVLHVLGRLARGNRVAEPGLDARPAGDRRLDHALRHARQHWLISGLGALLVLVSFVLPHASDLTVWNERVVGVLLVVLGLVAGGELPPEDT